MYLAIKDEREYALKIPREQKALAQDSFIREAVAYACVRHPGLAELFEVGDVDGQPYAIMESVPGGTLASLITRGQLGEAEVRRIGMELASALAEVHRHGLVHRDIKPTNILLSHSGALKLVDFGLAARTSREESDELMAAVGTFSYSSPEQTGMLHRPVDARSDLYSVGVVLFECAAGQLPFSAPDAATLMQLHLRAPLPDLRALNPGIGPALAAIIAKLLGKDPDDRYPSALALLEDLRELDTLNARASAGMPLQLGGKTVQPGWTYDSPLVGREQELSSLKKLWWNTTGGRGAAVLIEAPSGGGKTRLINELCAFVRPSNVPVLATKCIIDNAVPFAPIRSLVDSFLAELNRRPPADLAREQAQLIERLGDFAPLLKHFSPALEELLREVPTRASETKGAERFSRALALLLEAMVGSSEALLLVVDDVQWLDEGSRQVLRHLASELRGGAKVLIVAAARLGEQYTETVETFVHEMAGALSQRVALQPLTQADMRQMVRAQLGDGEVDEEVVNDIAARSAGNAFAVREYVFAMLESGYLRPSWGRWIVASSVRLQSLALPRDVLSMVVTRIDKLGKEVRELLSIAAILGGGFDQAMLQAVSGRRASEIAKALFEAERAHVIEHGRGGEYEFSHDRVQESLLAGLSPEEKRALHRRAAVALDREGELPPRIVYTVAKHYAAAASDELLPKTYAANLRAGKAAASNFAFHEAVGFLTTALETAKKAGITPELELHRLLGELSTVTSRLDVMEEHLGEFLKKSTDHLASARAHASLSHALTMNLRLQRSREEFHAALKELGLTRSGSALRQLVAVIGSWLHARFIEKTGIGFGAAQGAERKRLESLAYTYRESISLAMYSQDKVLWLEALTRPLLFALKLGPGSDLSVSYSSAAVAFASLLREKTSAELARKGKLLAERLGEPLAMAKSLWFEAASLGMLGRFREAERKYEQLRAKYVQWLEAWEFIASYIGQSWINCHWGHSRKTLTVAQHLFNQIEGLPKIPNQAIQAYSHQCTSFAMLGLRSEALDALRKAEKLGKLEGVNTVTRLGARIMFELESGSLDEAEAVVEQFRALKLTFKTRNQVYYGHLLFYACYVRLALCERQLSESAKVDSAHLSKLAVSMEELVKNGPAFELYQFHLHLIRAAYHRLTGAQEQAQQSLARAGELASLLESPWCTYELYVERAKQLAWQGNQLASLAEAHAAHGIATEQGWEPRARRVAERFRLNVAREATRSGPSTSTRSATGLATSRQRDALMQLSLLLSRELNVRSISRSALTHLIQLMSAERAYLVLVQPETGELRPELGLDAQGNELDKLTKFSTTVVTKVAATRVPLVVSGTDEQRVLGSESAVALDLRSIVAAPLALGEKREELIGVLYLDSRVAKGMFSAEDAELVEAIGNHIAISIKMAQAARLEIVKNSLEKDLEVTGAVQSLFLPPEPYIETTAFRIAALYRPAQSCGGDLWWCEPRADGGALILVGDVAGHGPGAAMITTAAATVFRRLLRAPGKKPSGREIASAVHDTLRMLTADKYTMTMTIAECDPTRKAVHLWFVGAPPVLHVSQHKSKIIRERSMPAGMEPLIVRDVRVSLKPQDRLVIVTDGILEQVSPATKRPIGMKKLCELVSGSEPSDLNAAVKQLGDELVQLGGTAWDDDVTLVMIQAR